MKKLLLLAAALFLAVACGSPEKPGVEPTPDPDPTPTGDPTISRTEIKQKASIDTAHIFIGNYAGNVRYGTEDPNFAVSFSQDEKTGAFIVSSMTAGSTKLMIECGETLFTIDCKWDPSVTVAFYTDVLNDPYGKTVDEVKALETARGNTAFEEEKTTSGTGFWLSVEAATPNANAVSESFEYYFPVTGGVTGLCVQTNRLTGFGADPVVDKDKALTSLTHLAETNYFMGQPWLDQEVEDYAALNRELNRQIQFRAAKYDATGPVPNGFLFLAMYSVFTPKASVAPMMSPMMSPKVKSLDNAISLDTYTSIPQSNIGRL